jgi:hypothetical protein
MASRNATINILDLQFIADRVPRGPVLNGLPATAALFAGYRVEVPVVNALGAPTGALAWQYSMWNGVGWASIIPGVDQEVTIHE